MAMLNNQMIYMYTMYYINQNDVLIPWYIDLNLFI